MRMPGWWTWFSAGTALYMALVHYRADEYVTEDVAERSAVTIQEVWSEDEWRAHVDLATRFLCEVSQDIPLRERATFLRCVYAVVDQSLVPTEFTRAFDALSQGGPSWDLDWGERLNYEGVQPAGEGD